MEKCGFTDNRYVTFSNERLVSKSTPRLLTDECLSHQVLESILG